MILIVCIMFVEQRRPGFALKTSAQYFSGECCANDTQQRIREVFITALSSSAYSSVCYPQECRYVKSGSVVSVYLCNLNCIGNATHI